MTGDLTPGPRTTSRSGSGPSATPAAMRGGPIVPIRVALAKAVWGWNAGQLVNELRLGVR